MNIINIEHLTHSFTERLLFDDVSFYLSDKDKVGVIGINGTGKSTLLKIIAGKEFIVLTNRQDFTGRCGFNVLSDFAADDQCRITSILC